MTALELIGTAVEYVLTGVVAGFGLTLGVALGVVLLGALGLIVL